MLGKIKDATKGSKKMLIVVGFAGVAFAAYSIMKSPEVPVNNSSVGAPPAGSQTVQASQQITKAYDEALSISDRDRIVEARDAGTSAIPTVRPNPSEQQVPVIDIEEPEAAAPEIELPEVKPPVIVQPTVPQAAFVQPPQQIRDPKEVENLAGKMLDFRRSIAVAEVIQFSTNAAIKAEIEASEAQSAPVGGSDGAVGQQENASKIKLPLSGTILYAELVSRANSDVPGPVLARVLQGEYTGATLIGSFQTAQNALVISFNKMTVKKTTSGEEINETVPIETVAVDTKYIGTGLATKVDRHLFQKLAIGFTASFAEGFGDALANNGSTTVVTEGGSTISSRPKLNTKEQLLSSGGKAVSNVGGILMDEFGRRPTTVIVESGTAIGVLFL